MDNPRSQLNHPDLPGPDNPEPEQDTPQNEPPGSTPDASALLAGKYRTQEELEKGYWEQNRSYQQLRQEYENLRRQQQQYQPPMESVPPPRRPERALADAGIPTDDLQYLIRSEIQQALTPIAEGFRARQTMEQRYDGFTREERAINGYLNDDPVRAQRYQRMYANDPEGAMEWAYLSYLRETKPSGQPRSAADHPGSGALPKTGSPAAKRGPDPVQEDRDAVAKAYEMYQQTGDPTQLVKSYLRPIIKDEHLAAP